jgi:hypothetical protein
MRYLQHMDVYMLCHYMAPLWSSGQMCSIRRHNHSNSVTHSKDAFLEFMLKTDSLPSLNCSYSIIIMNLFLFSPIHFKKGIDWQKGGNTSFAHKVSRLSMLKGNTFRIYFLWIVQHLPKPRYLIRTLWTKVIFSSLQGSDWQTSRLTLSEGKERWGHKAN